MVYNRAWHNQLTRSWPCWLQLPNANDPMYSVGSPGVGLPITSDDWVVPLLDSTRFQFCQLLEELTPFSVAVIPCNWHVHPNDNALCIHNVDIHQHTRLLMAVNDLTPNSQCFDDQGCNAFPLAPLLCFSDLHVSVKMAKSSGCITVWIWNRIAIRARYFGPHTCSKFVLDRCWRALHRPSPRLRSIASHLRFYQRNVIFQICTFVVFQCQGATLFASHPSHLHIDGAFQKDLVSFHFLTRCR